MYSSLLEESVSVTEFQATGANSSLVRTRAHEGVNGRKVVLWNQGVRTDSAVAANNPVIIIKGKKEKTLILIDVAITGMHVRES